MAHIANIAKHSNHVGSGIKGLGFRGSGFRVGFFKGILGNRDFIAQRCKGEFIRGMQKKR